MKNQLMTISAFIIFTLCAPVHAQTPQGALADATQTIAAQASVTRDTVAQMLRHMEEQSANIEFNARDYRVKTARFQQRITSVLQSFETYLSTSIFSRLSVLANRYNSIYNSTVLSPAQKTLLLEQQSVILWRTELPQIRNDYYRAIQNVYPRFLRRNLNFSTERGFQENLYPELRRGCRSQICLALSAIDLKTYINLVRTRIDKPLEIRLADQTTWTLYVEPMNVESIRSALSFVSYYPADAFTLPFDTEAE